MNAVANYVLTWKQNGKLMHYTPSFQDNFACLTLWLNVALVFMADDCIDNCLYLGGRLVARQATYNGVA